MSKPYLLALSLLAVVATCDAAHITDKLVVGLYASAAKEGTPRRLLSSGTPLEVLERADGFARVRLADGTQGWVEAGYVTEEKPAKAMLLETQARLRQMGLELAALRAAAGGDRPPSVEQARPRDAPAQARLGGLEQGAGSTVDAALQARYDDLRGRASQAVELLRAAPGVAPATAAGAADGWWDRHGGWLTGLAAAAAGFAAGVAFIDYRFRRRHGGFRL